MTDTLRTVVAAAVAVVVVVVVKFFWIMGNLVSVIYSGHVINVQQKVLIDIIKVERACHPVVSHENSFSVYLRSKSGFKNVTTIYIRAQSNVSNSSYMEVSLAVLFLATDTDGSNLPD
jgi:hypothetical protein